MLNEHRPMRWLSIFVVVGLAGGCGTRANPESCLDGLCTDQAFPFCDADGALEGEPGKCIAVSCTPAEVVACRGEQALTCNAAGNDFDLVQCPLGCDAANGGCQGCATNDQCSNPAPICDPGAHECRTCRTDDECASRVCDLDSGACLAESEVVYASPAGAASGPCSLAAPCSLPRAVSTASANPLRANVRALPGTYVEGIEVTGTIKLIGTGAVLQAPGFAVNAGGSATVRDLAMDLPAGQSLRCSGESSSNRAALHLRDVEIVMAGFGSVAQMFICDVTMQRVSLTRGTLELATQSVFDADRMRLVDVFVSLRGTESRSKFTNSVFVNSFFSSSTIDTTTQSRFDLAFNTFSSPNETFWVVDCGGTSSNVNFVGRFENNIILGNGSDVGGDVIRGTKCSFSNNIFFPQTSAIPGPNMVVDPKFVNGAAGDLHLQATSPAINAAMPSTGLTSDHDFEGAARPQGGQHDIGAFERTP
jgi:hypothetical protein